MSKKAIKAIPILDLSKSFGKSQLNLVVEEIAELDQVIKLAEKELVIYKDRLKAAARLSYFVSNDFTDDATGDHAHSTVFSVEGKNQSVQLNFDAQYSLNAERFEQLSQTAARPYLEKHEVVTIDSYALHKTNQVSLYKELAAVCKKYGLTGIVDDKYVVNPDFHTARHSIISVDENLGIDEIMPVRVSVTVTD
jgi:hypothetical protein